MNPTKQVTTNAIGSYVDSIAGNSRTVGSVAGRLIEETVELCLAAGLTTPSIMSHVIDSLAKQSAKETIRRGSLMLPSQLESDRSELGGECADVSLILKDVCHVAGIELEAEEIRKFDKLKNSKIKVSSNGTISTIKSQG